MELIQRVPPPPPVSGPQLEANTELDHMILFIMQSRGNKRDWTPRELSMATESEPKDVWRRLHLLWKRGLVARDKTPDGPRRGPGSHTYRVAPPTE